ncbi:hypothetical protein Bbelb_168920 [Branchiostoma belcheri]|nr:hypothetical protein Bbelb_168920 [Branchiostoma belcheri]
MAANPFNSFRARFNNRNNGFSHCRPDVIDEKFASSRVAILQAWVKDDAIVMSSNIIYEATDPSYVHGSVRSYALVSTPHLYMMTSAQKHLIRGPAKGMRTKQQTTFQQVRRDGTALIAVCFDPENLGRIARCDCEQEMHYMTTRIKEALPALIQNNIRCNDPKYTPGYGFAILAYTNTRSASWRPGPERPRGPLTDTGVAPSANLLTFQSSESSRHMGQISKPTPVGFANLDGKGNHRVRILTPRGPLASPCLYASCSCVGGRGTPEIDFVNPIAISATSHHSFNAITGETIGKTPQGPLY